MSVIIFCKARLGDGDATSLIASVQSLIEQARSESGCLAYDWSVDPNDSKRLHIFEHWASVEALEDHFKTPSFAELGGVIAATNPTESDAIKYEVGRFGPLFGVTGVPVAGFD